MSYNLHSSDFLPISLDEARKRGWNELDIVIVSGDAYVDHPSYGTALISRFLESKGFKVGIIAQPNWCTPDDFKRLGRPRLFFAVTSGNVDSMIANYTANKISRKTDDYSPLQYTHRRPDRALIVYTNRLKEVFPDSVIVLGGIEASMRRLAHYDYWDNRPRRSVLVDAKADLLVYGMAEKAIEQVARRLDAGEKINQLNNINGTVIIRKTTNEFKNIVNIPSFEDVLQDKKKFNQSFVEIYQQQNPFTAKPLAQKHGDRFVVHLPPQLPLSENELDSIYHLPYTRSYHPVYEKLGGVKGLATVKFSLTSHRGCCGECSFCSLYFHQGRIVQSRSEKSILQEIETISQQPDFRGTITDIGGPTANLYQAKCLLWQTKGFCSGRKCLTPDKCKNLRLGYGQCLSLYKKARLLKGVKHVFIASGFRYDLLVDHYSNQYLDEVCRHHISGQMKVAPEHISDDVLVIMNKPQHSKYEKFLKRFEHIAKKHNVFLVNYFISSHPAATLLDALRLALFCLSRKIFPEQVQDYIPLPMTLSSCLYYTGWHPFTNKQLFSAVSFLERKMQRALLQSADPKNQMLMIKALELLGRQDLMPRFKISETVDKFKSRRFSHNRPNAKSWRSAKKRV